MHRPRLAAPIALALILAASGAAQTTWYVDDDGTPPGSGTPSDPYTSIQYAIERPTTVDGDTVLVLAGTYVENVDYQGKGLELRSLQGPTVTTIDGGNVDSAVKMIKGEGSGTRLEGFTITNGKGTTTLLGGFFIYVGGGIVCFGSSPEISGCAVEGNYAYHFGGGIFLSQSNATISSCTVSDNVAQGFEGGGVFAHASTVDVLDSEVSGNTAADGGMGAGLALVQSHVLVERCTVTGNTADNDHKGGGLYVEGGRVTARQTSFSDNYSNGGGGAFIGSGQVLFDSCRFLSNTAQVWQAGTGNGGGVLVEGGTVDLLLCTIAGNVSIGAFGPGEGGGVWGATSLEKCTVAQNTADAYGGVCGGSLHNCIVWSNTPVAYCGGTMATWSDMEGGLAGTGNIDADPLFWDPLDRDFHLQAASPCIDTGDPAGPPDPGGSRADMGAFPYDPYHCGTPRIHCTAKVSSMGCTPTIGYSGSAGFSNPNPFDITAAQVINNKNGILFYGLNGPQAVPFQGGWLCAQPPLKRTPVQGSGGNPPPDDCSGSFSFDFNAWAQSGSDPNLAPGVLVNGQFWYREPQSPSTTGLTDAIEFPMCP